MKSYRAYTKRAEEVGKAKAEGEHAASAEELAKRLAAAYNGKSNAAMMKSIVEEAERSKRAGTLSNEEIERFYQSFAPMLSGTQRKRLQEVVARLKGM